MVTKYFGGTASATHPMLEGDRASDWMGIRVLTAQLGHAIIEMDIKHEMVNGFGIIHGGMTFAFADTAFALTVNSLNPEEFSKKITVSSGADINYVASAREGQTLRAEGKLAASYGRNSLVDVTVTCEGQLIAEFRGRGRTITPPTASEGQ